MASVIQTVLRRSKELIIHPYTVEELQGIANISPSPLSTAKLSRSSATMPEGEAPPAPIQPQESSRGSSQSRRNRGRSGRGRGSQPNGATQRGGRSAAPQQNRDSSTAAPEPTPIAQGSTPSSNSRASRGGRSRRGRRGGGESSVQQPEARHLRAGPSRTFGGHLTVDASESSSAALALSLSADAPEFVPGQPLVTRRWVFISLP